MDEKDFEKLKDFTKTLVEELAVRVHTSSVTTGSNLVASIAKKIDSFGSETISAIQESVIQAKKDILEATKEAQMVLQDTGIVPPRFMDVTRIPLVCQSILTMGETLTKIEKKIDEKMVTQDQFYPVKAIAYTAMGAIGLAFLGAIFSVILKT